MSGSTFRCGVGFARRSSGHIAGHRLPSDHKRFAKHAVAVTIVHPQRRLDVAHQPAAKLHTPRHGYGGEEVDHIAGGVLGFHPSEEPVVGVGEAVEGDARTEEAAAVRGCYRRQLVHGVLGPDGGDDLIGDGRRDRHGQRDALAVDRSCDVLHVELHRLGIKLESPAVVAGPVSSAAVEGRGDLVVEVEAEGYYNSSGMRVSANTER